MTVKATKATITLGNIELDCYQMPDGQYKMTVTQTCEACNLDPKRFPQLLELKQVKALAQAGLVTPDFVVKGRIETADGIRQAKLIDLKLVSLIWRLGGTPLGQDLVDACLIEALERRADSAFGIVRSEDERNDFLKARATGKVKRRTLTDAIDKYIAGHPELSDNYRSFVYVNCTNYHNLVVLGMRSKDAKIELELKPSALLRDNLPEKALAELASVEEIACRIIEHEDLEPLEAVKKSVAIHYTKTIGIH